jgi:hypothetical protein
MVFSFLYLAFRVWVRKVDSLEITAGVELVTTLGASRRSASARIDKERRASAPGRQSLPRPRRSAQRSDAESQPEDETPVALAVRAALSGESNLRTPHAWRFVREPTLRLVFKDLGFSLHDRGDDAFLYAYRAVENARRFHADKVSATETTPVGPPLQAALVTSEGQLQPLTEAATSIRHGDTKSAALAAARV